MATLTKQQLFSSSMIAFMQELKGGFLKKFCETKTATGGESLTFNRLAEATAKADLKSMFDSTFGAGDGGDMKDFKAMITQISAQMKVKEVDMNKTSIDIKNGYVKSLGNAVMRKEDLEILKAVRATADLVKAGLGAAGDTFATETVIKKLVSQIRKAQALADYTPDNHRGVALVMTPEDYADMASSDVMINADYANAFAGGVNGTPTTFFGAEIVLVKANNTEMKAGEVFLIPSNTVAFAEWEGSTIGDAIWVPSDARTWHLQAIKSVGAIGIEGKSIALLSSTSTEPTA